jgi:hypothetical protein
VSATAEAIGTFSSSTAKTPKTRAESAARFSELRQLGSLSSRS